MGTCSVDGCEKDRYRLDMCSIHYRRNLTHGDPLTTKKRANGDGFMALGYAARQIDGIKKFDHVRIVEAVIGKELRAGVVIHHWNEVKSDNRNENLLVCQDRAYHNLIHARTRAYDACGNASWRPCSVCKKYDDVENFQKPKIPPLIARHVHSKCASNRTKINQQKRMELRNE